VNDHSDLSNLLREKTMLLKKTVRNQRNLQYHRSMHITSSSRHMNDHRL
jgi:hypothetical protein